jgi:hypothetical protein
MAEMIDPPQVLSEEPTAVTPHGGFCGGESQQWPSYPTKLHVRICEGGVKQSTPLLDPVEPWSENHAALRLGRPKARSRLIFCDFDFLRYCSLAVRIGGVAFQYLHRAGKNLSQPSRLPAASSG